jgi:hypothetical protein
MRQGPNPKRSRGRNNNNNSNNNNNNGRRPNMPLRMQTFDSNGPDVRIRGSAFQVHEKYLQLARDASSSGDRIIAESYLQHAEHYYRIIAAVQEQQQQNGNDPNRRYRPEGGYAQDYRQGQSGEEQGGETSDEFPEESNDAPQLRGDGSYRQQPESQQNRLQGDGQYRSNNDGQNRQDRGQDRDSQYRAPSSDRGDNNYRQDAGRQDAGRQDVGRQEQPREDDFRRRQHHNDRRSAQPQSDAPQSDLSQSDLSRPDLSRSDARQSNVQVGRQPEQIHDLSNGHNGNRQADDIVILTQPDLLPQLDIATPETVVEAAPPRRGRPRRERPAAVEPEPVTEG